MTCDKSAKLGHDYVNGTLPYDVHCDYEAHVSECPACMRDIEATRQLVESLRSLSARRSPVDCWTHVGARIAEMERQRSPWYTYLLRPVVAAPAFGLAVLLGVLLIVPAQMDSEEGLAMAAPEYQHYITAHSRLQRQQLLGDPDVTFIATELEKASVSTDAGGR